MTETPGAGTHGTSQASAPPPYWRSEAKQETTAFVVARDTVIRWDRSQIPVRRGTVVHARVGSELWRAYGGEDGLLPVHGGQARP